MIELSGEKFSEVAARILDRLGKAEEDVGGFFERVPGTYLLRKTPLRREGYAFYITVVRWSDEAARRNPDFDGLHAVPQILEDPKARYSGVLDDTVRCQAPTQPVSNHSDYRCRHIALPGHKYCAKHVRFYEAWEKMGRHVE